MGCNRMPVMSHVVGRFPPDEQKLYLTLSPPTPRHHRGHGWVIKRRKTTMSPIGATFLACYISRLPRAVIHGSVWYIMARIRFRRVLLKIPLLFYVC